MESKLLVTGWLAEEHAGVLVDGNVHMCMCREWLLGETGQEQEVGLDEVG